MDEGNLLATLERSFELQIQLSEADSNEAKVQLMKDYIESAASNVLITLPEFNEDWEWFNTSRPLIAQQDLTGRIVVLDFFTYCCINCIHILPDLDKLEQLFPVEDGVIVIGVHSAKFDNEKISANILSAVLRHSITHPVVNDREATLWQQLQISCWPTLVILGPSNEILLILAGEGHSETTELFVRVAKEFYENKGTLKRGQKANFISLEKNNTRPSTLRFPGKICWDQERKRLAISDTGQHRVLVTDGRGVITHVVGGPNSGLEDGVFAEARFFNPQGVAWRKDVVYVADADNHCIRQIDLAAGQVTTVAGTGRQGHDLAGGKVGREQAISSPWDVALGSSKGGKDDILFIAMAGSHQIWMYFLESGKWLKNKDYKSGCCVMFAGSGREENRNNNYPHRAAFAQPSGIAVGKTGDLDTLFVADAESSSVRTISLVDGSVKNLVGGDKDPSNLFAYGDEDGVGTNARLQHPLGIAVLNNASLLLADSYNHKIKKVDLTTKSCQTLPAMFGARESPSGNNSNVLNEPGGVCLHPTERSLYIADTNNHRILSLDLDTNELSTVPVILPSAVHTKKDLLDSTSETSVTDRRGPPKSIVPKRHCPVALSEVCVHPEGKLTLDLKLELGESLHLTDEAPGLWQVLSTDESCQHLLEGLGVTTKGHLVNLEEQPSVTVRFPEEWSDRRTSINLECVLYYCGDDGACRMKAVVFTQPVWITVESVDLSVVQSLTHKFT